MKGLIEKTVGILPALKAELKRFDDRIELALLYGSAARGEEKSGGDIDLMVVGSLKQIDLLSTLRKLESRFRREVTVTLFSSEEFHRKLAVRDHFLKAVLKTCKLSSGHAPAYGVY